MPEYTPVRDTNHVKSARERSLKPHRPCPLSTTTSMSSRGTSLRTWSSPTGSKRTPRLLRPVEEPLDQVLAAVPQGANGSLGYIKNNACEVMSIQKAMFVDIMNLIVYVRLTLLHL